MRTIDQVRLLLKEATRLPQELVTHILKQLLGPSFSLQGRPARLTIRPPDLEFDDRWQGPGRFINRLLVRDRVRGIRYRLPRPGEVGENELPMSEMIPWRFLGTSRRSPDVARIPDYRRVIRKGYGSLQ